MESVAEGRGGDGGFRAEDGVQESGLCGAWGGEGVDQAGDGRDVGGGTDHQGGVTQP